MSRLRKSLPLLMLGIGLSVGLLIGVGMMFGALAALHQAASSGHAAADGMLTPEMLLRASSAHGGKTLAMATGQIDDEVEGVFVLDFLTGDMYCWVVFSRNPQAGYVGIFKQNIAADLPPEKGKDPDYVLVTGGIQAVKGSGANWPSNCVVYVGDSNTGNVAAYMISWNKTMASAGRPQIGPMVPIAVAKARPNIERE